MTARSFCVQAVTATAVAALATAVTAVPALAHVEVSADRAQAGATDVLLSFEAESESKTAGISSLRVVLPAGIAPAGVGFVSGPPGWTFTPTGDGYVVGGPPVSAGENAEYQVKFAQLPAEATELPFKTLQSYSDGRVDRWIELPAPGAGELAQPAPMLSLQPAAPAAGSMTGTTTQAPPQATETPAAAPVPERETESASSYTWIWFVGAAVAAFAVGGSIVAIRRRRAG